MEVPAGATHKFRGEWFREFAGAWAVWRETWETVDRCSFDLLNRQAAPITDYMRALGHLEAVLCAAEDAEECLESDRGYGRSARKLYEANEMPEELVAARAFLAQLKGE
jgi:hypothetical protein